MDMQKTREELVREEEEEREKARREEGGRREVALVVEIVRRNEKIGARPVTRDRED